MNPKKNTSVTRLILALLFLLLSSPKVLGQIDSLVPVDSAQYFAQRLKQGTLLVELDDREGTRNKLLKAKDSVNLKKFDAQLAREFQEIFVAFSSSYNFSAVYFYKKSDRDQVLAKNFSNCSIFDKQGQAIQLKAADIPIVFFGQFIKYDFKENMASKDKDSGTYGQSVFLIRNERFEVLNPKFKLYTKLAFRKKKNAIANLNSKLLKLIRP